MGRQKNQHTAHNNYEENPENEDYLQRWKWVIFMILQTETKTMNSVFSW